MFQKITQALKVQQKLLGLVFSHIAASPLAKESHLTSTNQKERVGGVEIRVLSNLV